MNGLNAAREIISSVRSTGYSVLAPKCFKTFRAVVQILIDLDIIVRIDDRWYVDEEKWRIVYLDDLFCKAARSVNETNAK